MVITGHGGPEVFAWQERPKPALKEFDVLVEVRATSISPVDCKVRSGTSLERQFPLILGYDASGTVVEVGDRVSNFRPGDEIYAALNILRDGANAEYVAVDSRSAALKPQTLSDVKAAILPRAAIAAWESLHLRAKIQPGQTVLIHAGAGGVGHLAIQLAKLHGCRTIVTASREEALRFCRDTLEADEVIDYKSIDFVQQVTSLVGGNGCPLVLDMASQDVFARALEGLSGNGAMTGLLSPEPPSSEEKLFLRNATQHHESIGFPTAYRLYLERHRKILCRVRDLVDSGQLVPYVSHQFSLGEVARAHALQESGCVIGKIAIRI